MNIRPIVIGLFLVLLGLIIYKGFDRTFSQDGYKESGINKRGKLEVVVLDAGHGGFDHGCSGRLSEEKQISLSIIKKLEAKIKAAYPDLKVVLTRDKDIFIALDERAKVANINKADLFLSVHCNYYKKNDVFGTETFVRRNPTSPAYGSVSQTAATINRELKYERDILKYNKEKINEVRNNVELNIKHSTLFAGLIEKNFQKEASRFSRGVKHANFYVLKNTWMPSVLVEAGFLSNVDEEKYLSSDYGQKTIVNSIFLAFSDYKDKLESQKVEEIDAILDSVVVKKDDGITVDVKNNLEAFDVNPRDTVKTVVTIKEEKPKAEPKVEQPKNIEKIDAIIPDDKVNFRVQLIVKSAKDDIKQGVWTEVPGIEVIPVGSVYKYMTKRLDTYAASLTLKEKMKEKGFSDAFIVAFKGDDKISLATALKTTE